MFPNTFLIIKVIFLLLASSHCPVCWRELTLIFLFILSLLLVLLLLLLEGKKKFVSISPEINQSSILLQAHTHKAAAVMKKE
jgi:hypothetical protein